MIHIRKILPFVKPYWKRALVALILLTSLVFLDLAIPRLIQRIIDQGITPNDQAVVVQTALLMIGISVLSTIIAIGNNISSVQVGESVARDLREAIFLKIQTFSFGNLDQQKTGQLMVRLTSDASAVQRLVQVSLRIGTRAPLLMIGSLLLMINTSPQLALTLLPLLAGHIGDHRFLHLQNGAALSHRSTKVGSAQYCVAGKHRGCPRRQSVRARRF